MATKKQDRNARHFFEVYGPFELPLQKGKCIKPNDIWWREEFEQFGEYTPARAIGCYMFTLGRKNIKPWYVGKTWCEGGFRNEVFTDHKLVRYNEALKGRRGPAQIFFFPLITQSFHDPMWRLSYDRTSTKRLIAWLERTLIGMALARNPLLTNTRDATFLRTVRLRGILGSNPIGRPDDAVVPARRALLGQ